MGANAIAEAGSREGGPDLEADIFASSRRSRTTRPKATSLTRQRRATEATFRTNSSYSQWRRKDKHEKAMPKMDLTELTRREHGGSMRIHQLRGLSEVGKLTRDTLTSERPFAVNNEEENLEAEVNVRRVMPQDSRGAFGSRPVAYRMWNIRPSKFGRLSNGHLKSTQCTWYLDDQTGEGGYDLEYPWNV